MWDGPGHTAPRQLLADVRAARGADSATLLPAILHRWRLRPLTGGRSNTVYAWSDPLVGATCIKLYDRVDDRRRIEREWAALTLLAAHGVDGAPAPLWIDRAPCATAIGMTALPGTCPLDADDPRPGLLAMAALTRRIQAVPLTGLLATIERVDSAAHYQRRLTRVWPDQLAAHPHDPLTADMRALLAAWHTSGDPETLSALGGPVLSRGDANLRNWLHDGRDGGCVDFEYSGYSTPVFDAADHVEHISARAIGDSTWQEVVAALGVHRGDYAQFLAAQRTCALRWLAVLWRQRHHRADEFAVQLARVRMLQSDTSNCWRT